MKLTGILLSIVGLATGGVAGLLLARQTHALPQTTFIASQVRALPKSTPRRIFSLPSPTIVPAFDLTALLKEENSYRRLRGLAAYIAKLRSEDLSAAIEAVRNGQGPGRDNLLEVLLGRRVEEDTQAALTDAESISNPHLRHDQLVAIIEHLIRKDPFNAIEIIKTSSLPEADKKKLLDKVPQVREYPYPLQVSPPEQGKH